VYTTDNFASSTKKTLYYSFAFTANILGKGDILLDITLMLRQCSVA